MAALAETTHTHTAGPRAHARAVAAPRLAGGRLLAANLAGDAVALLAAAWLVQSVAQLVLVPTALAVLAHRGLYRDRPVAVLDGARSLLTGVTVAAAMALLATSLLTPDAVDPRAAAHGWILAAGLLAAERLAVTLLRRRDLRAAGVPTAVVAAGERAESLVRLLRETPDAGLHPVGMLRPDAGTDPDGLAAMAADTGALHLVVADADADVATLARACARRGLSVSVAPAAADAGAALAVEHVGPLTLLRLTPAPAGSPGLAVKHAADRAVAGLLLLAAAPLLAAVALAVRLSSPGPVLFRQRRVGRDGREFAMLKFRSMRVDGQAPAAALRLPAGAAPGGVEGLDRRTAVGTLLRRTSLDELPQLLNVLRGEMSLVGPRPERPEFVGRFATEVPRYQDRHRLKAGMTGLAQVQGLRGRTSLADRIAYDNHYCEHWSLWLDVKVLLRTAGAVLRPAE